MKTCNKCQKELPESEFNLRSSLTGERRGDCRDCCKDRNLTGHRVSMKKLLAHDATGITTKEKRCNRCGAWKPETVFALEHSFTEKRRNICGSCVANDRDKTRVQARRFRCTCCKLLLPRSRFYTRDPATGRPMSQCKRCQIENGKAGREAAKKRPPVATTRPTGPRPIGIDGSGRIIYAT